MEQKLDIRELKIWVENKDTLERLVNDYFDLPTEETIRGNFIVLTEEERRLVETTYNYITEYEREIKLTMENSHLFNRIEQLKRNSIIKREV